MEGAFDGQICDTCIEYMDLIGSEATSLDNAVIKVYECPKCRSISKVVIKVEDDEYGR